MSTLNPVAAATIQALSFEDKTAAYDQGGRYARSKLETLNVAQDAARTLGVDPSFDRWENYRMEWVAGHAHVNPELTGNAHDAAWSDFAKLLNTLYGLTKPASKSAAATKKASERAAADTKLLEKHEDTPVIELRDQLSKTFEKMAKNPTSSELKKTQKELERVIKLRTSEENKAHGEALKALRAQVREAAAKCIDIEKLEAALEVLDADTELTYTVED